jgi:putative ABC transport system permease protein
MLGKMVRKSLLKNIRITIWTLATLTLCAALVVVFTAISIDVERKMSRSMRRLGANAVVHQEVEPQMLGMMKKQPNWQVVETLAKTAGADALVLQARIGTVMGKPLVLVSAESAALARMTAYWMTEGKHSIDPGECLVGKRVANSLKVELGAMVTVQWPTPRQTSQLRVAGIFESGDDDETRIFANSLDFASKMDVESVIAQLPTGHANIRDRLMSGQANGPTCHESGVIHNDNRHAEILNPQPIATTVPAVPPPTLSYALLSVPGGEQGIRQLAQQLDEMEAGVSAKPLRQILHGERRVLQKIMLLSGLALTAVLVLSALGVSTATLARIVERRQELALLQALGGARRSVVAFLLCESAAVGAVASVVGFVFGAALAQVVVRHVFHVSITLHPVLFLSSLATAMAVALLAGGAAAHRTLGMEPAIALKGE